MLNFAHSVFLVIGCVTIAAAYTLIIAIACGYPMADTVDTRTIGIVFFLITIICLWGAIATTRI